MRTSFLATESPDMVADRMEVTTRCRKITLLKPSSYARIGANFLISRVAGPKEHSRDFHQPLNSSTPSPKQIRSQLIEVQRAMGFEYNTGKAWDAFAGGETREALDFKVVLI